MPINKWSQLNKFIGITSIFVIILLVYTLKKHYFVSTKTLDSSPIDYFVTAKGRKHLGDVIEHVFKKYGYTLIKHDLIPILKKSVPMNCDETFFEAQRIAENSVKTDDAPRELFNAETFLLNNYSKLMYGYCNQIPKNEESSLLVWEEQFVNDYVNTVKVDPHGIPATYSNESVAVYMATKYFNINGQTGAVIGSLTPWVESYLLANGAKNLTTVDYKKIKIMHPQINFLYAPELAVKQKTYNSYFDFVVSFSSIEHSGLGRFGDPMDPIGDLREMNKIHCMLKNGGLFFVGFPVGSDAIVFNAHRIYGRMRLALMFEGFKILDVFYGDSKMPITLTQELLEGGFRQFLFVLQKTV